MLPLSALEWIHTLCFDASVCIPPRKEKKEQLQISKSMMFEPIRVADLEAVWMPAVKRPTVAAPQLWWKLLARSTAFFLWLPKATDQPNRCFNRGGSHSCGVEICGVQPNHLLEIKCVCRSSSKVRIYQQQLTLTLFSLKDGLLLD